MSLVLTRKTHLRIPGTPYLIIAEISIMNPVVAKTRMADGYLQMGQLAQAGQYYDEVLEKSNYKYALFGKLRLIKSESSTEETKLNRAAKIFNILFDQESNDTRILHEYNTFKDQYPDIGTICRPPDRP